jgi:hypothetical protein
MPAPRSTCTKTYLIMLPFLRLWATTTLGNCIRCMIGIPLSGSWGHSWAAGSVVFSGVALADLIF